MQIAERFNSDRTMLPCGVEESVHLVLESELRREVVAEELHRQIIHTVCTTQQSVTNNTERNDNFSPRWNGIQ